VTRVPPLPSILVLGPVLVVGLAGTVVALAGRGAEASFLHDQEAARQPLRAREVERVVRTAPEPVEAGSPEGEAATCRPRGSGPLRNPWVCRVDYHSGSADYRVEVNLDGSYEGRHIGGTGTATGCCIRVPD
jgi:hypothetical protein